MATVTYSQSGFYLHNVLKEVKRKKNPHHSNICSWYWFDTDWNSWVGCLWYCDNREPSILFKYKLFYVWFAVLCVTRGALVPRKRAYTAWRNKNKSNGHRNKLCPLFGRFPVCTQCGGMLQYRELKIKSVLFKLVECGWMNKAESYCEGTGNQERQRSVLLKDNRCFVRCHRDLRIKLINPNWDLLVVFLS